MRNALLVLGVMWVAGCAPDRDGDGFDVTEDCNDELASVNPAAAEVCNGRDDDCDGVSDGMTSTDLRSWYLDFDNDGYGAGESVELCDAPPRHIADNTDCDDADGNMHPDAAEDDCADPTDYNCDGSSSYIDADGDGFAACEDCDDADSGRNADATERCDGVDNDCDGDTDEDPTDPEVWYVDADADGFGDASTSVAACTQPDGFVSDDTDCNDADAATHPGASELCDGSNDEDCDGFVDEADAVDATLWFADDDGDSFGDIDAFEHACHVPTGFVEDHTDCDDAAAEVHPGAEELCDGAVDHDCDGDVDGPVVTTTSDYDFDGDGAVDIRLTTTYDSDGNLLIQQSEALVEVPADPFLADIYLALYHYVDTYTYDADGNLLLVERDLLTDGSVDITWTSTYDTDGNLLTQENTDPSHYFNPDGNFNYTTYTYDSDGNLLSRELDDSNDGTVDDRWTYTYDSDGNMLTEQHQGYTTIVSFSFEPDGSPTAIVEQGPQTHGHTITYTYESDGSLRTMEKHSDPVFTGPSWYAFHTYDGDGNLLTEEVDDDADGTFDSLETRTYDGDGNLLTVVKDAGADGTPDHLETRTYDGDGNLLTVVKDSGADGTFEYRETRTYDGDGNLLTVVKDSGADGTFDYRETRTYDGDGNLLDVAEDSDGDGTLNTLETYAYDAVGTTRTIHWDRDGDGFFESIDTTTDDSAGNPLAWTWVHTDASGVVLEQQSATYNYSCP